MTCGIRGLINMIALKLWKPFFIENSRVPALLSRVSPISIRAISLGLWVFCKGKINKTTRRHETIHFQQQLELLFVGFLVLYGLFWLVGMVRYRDGAKAYRENPFEREAYSNEKKRTYLDKRKRYAWLNYVLI